MKTLITTLLTLILTFSVFAQSATVVSENANLMGTPSEKGKVVNTLSRNTKVEVITQLKEWVLVQSTDYVGWLPGKNLDLDKMPSPKMPVMTPGIPQMVTAAGNVKSRKYIRGSRGVCYYITSNGKKTYVDRSLCN